MANPIQLKPVPNPGSDPNLRTIWENFSKIRNHFPNYNLLDYGAKGDGTTDDSAAIQACHDAATVGATIVIPPSRYRLASRLHLTKKLHYIGFGIGSCLYPDTGTGTDGILLGGASDGGVHCMSMRDLSILANGNVRDSLVMEGVFRSQFYNVHVNGSSRYEINMRGCLNNYFNFIISHNFAYPYPSGGSFDNTNGLIRVGPKMTISGSGNTATNANEFDLILEGGVFTPGTSAAYYQETQNGEGNNWIHGVIEGQTGRAIEIYGSSYGRIADLHGEATGNMLLSSCRAWSLGGGLKAGDVSIVDTTDTVIDGVECANLSIDATSRVILGAVSYNGGSLTDSSVWTSTLMGGRQASNGSQLEISQAPSQIKNLIWNGDFRRFTSVPAPDGFANIGGAPAYVQTGLSLADTTRNIGPYAVKITTGATNQGISWSNVLAGTTKQDKTTGYWVTASCWVKSSSGSPTLTFRARNSSGGTVASTSTTSTSWTPLRLCFYCDAAYTSVDVDLISSVSGSVFYTADWSLVHGYGAAITNAPNPMNIAGDFVLIGGRKISWYDGDPGAGGSTIGYSNAGDMAIDPTPASQGYGIWLCKTAGNPGTWDAFTLGTQPISSGGTGASTASAARDNLGLGSANDVSFANLTQSKSGADTRHRINAATGFYGYTEWQENGTTKWQMLNYPTTSELTIEKSGGGKVLRMDQSTGKVIATYRFEQSKQNANVTAANDITLAADGNVVNITGTTQINRILTTDWQAGSSVTLLLPASGVVAHNGAASGSGYARILLNTGANFTAGAAGGIVYLTYDGTDFRGVA